VLYGTKEAPFQARKGPRVYPQEYRKKSFMPDNEGLSQEPGERLKAILDDMNNWI
jgi:hypothetical protein